MWSCLLCSPLIVSYEQHPRRRRVG
jgi:hypothetical protein